MDGLDGHCFAALYVRDGFNDPERAITKTILELNAERLVWDVPVEDWLTSLNTADLDTLPIAISVYHDKNDNGKLDKNSFGLPTERYGFSNDPARGFGPPRFSQTAMPLGPLLQKDAGVEIQLH
jgi:uncharacterized protein (DUF2141 family)